MNQVVKRYVLLAVLMVASGLAGYLLLRPQAEAQGSGIPPGRPAPEFTLTSVDGESLTLSGLQGKAVVLNFWASWCVPCRTEMPALNETYNQFRDQGLVMVGVNIRESAVSIKAFRDRYGLQFPLLLDSDGKVTDHYDILPLPTTYFIDRQGVVRRRFEGQLSPSMLQQFVREVM